MRLQFAVFIAFFVWQAGFAAELSPIGAIVAVGTNASGMFVSGWAQDPKLPAEAVRVDLYINRPAQGPDYSNFVGKVTANLAPEPASGLTGFTGNHGFRFYLPLTRLKEIVDPERAIYAYAYSAGGVTPIARLNLTPVKLPRAMPIGAITGVRQDSSGLFVLGTARDSANPDGPVQVHFYINRPAQGPDYSNSVGRVDLAAGGSFQFKFPLNRVKDLDPSTRALYAYAVSKDQARITRLNSAPYVLPHAKPVGAIERYESGPKGVFVTGWALDPAAPDAAVRVDLYRDRPAQGPDYSNFLGKTTAGLDRPDVRAATGVAGHHGFRFQLPLSQLGDDRPVYAYAYSALNGQLLTFLNPSSPLTVPRLAFNQLLLGNNLDWVANGDGLFEQVPTSSGTITRPKPMANRLVTELGVKILRYPGGNLAECYDWADSIDNYPGRAGGRPEVDYRDCQAGSPTNTRINVGIDEFLRFCEANGIEPLITVGVTNNTAEHVADLVEYVHGAADSLAGPGTPWGNLRARNGHPAPYKVRYWEIGNEIYKDSIAWLPAEGRWDRAARLAGAQTREQIIAKATQYGLEAQLMARAMKARAPGLVIGVIGLGSVPYWDDAALGPCAGNAADYAVMHRYFPNLGPAEAQAYLQPASPVPTPDELLRLNSCKPPTADTPGVTAEQALQDAVLRAPARMIARELSTLGRYARGEAGRCVNERRKMKLALSEYNLDFGAITAGGGTQQRKASDMEQALFLAESIRQLSLSREVLFATKYNIAHASNHFFSDIHVAVTTRDPVTQRLVYGPTRLTPSFFAQKLFKQAAFTSMFEVRISVPPVLPELVAACVLPDVKNVASGELTPMVTTLAGRNVTGGVSILVINRDPVRAQQGVSLALPGLITPAQIKVTTLAAPGEVMLPPGWEGLAPDALPTPYVKSTVSALTGLSLPASSLTLLEIPASALGP